MRVVILGIDAIEYDLVEKWDMRYLKQEEYGKTVLPIDDEDGFFFTEPSTPIIWTSFITGTPPKKHGVDMLEMWIFPLNTFYRYVMHKLIGIGRRIPRSPEEWSEHKWEVDLDSTVSKLKRKFNLSWKPSRTDIKRIFTKP